MLVFSLTNFIMYCYNYEEVNMKDCLFCKIVKGEIPSYKIYEDENVYAFLDIANDVFGHTLVVSKKHFENVMDCSERTLGKIIASVKKIGDHFVKDCGFSGYNILNNSGKSAEQSVMHLHFHILPRKEGDDFKLWRDFGESGKTLEEVQKELVMQDEQKDVLDYSSFKEDCTVLYTDGACSGNPGIGGYGAVLIKNNGEAEEISGGEKLTTNNRMELTAVIEGLKLTSEREKVKVYSDSAYVVNAFNQGWIDNWKRNGWHSSGGGEVLNSDLWQTLASLVDARRVEFIKVKGHSDNAMNNRCDALATSFYKE